MSDGSRGEEDAQEPQGPLLGRYRLGPVIGRGGMGTVYRGEDTRLGRAVAIKILAPHLAADPLFKGRLLAEARAAAGLPHPHIVQVLDAQGEEESVVLVMELVEGESLRERLERAPLSVEEAVEVAAQVAEALAFAHSRGIVHRDVKPHNVLLRDAPPESSAWGGSHGRPLVWAKLADFGIARAVDATSTLTAAGMVLGSAPYLAPELLEGEAASPESDVYALGVTLFQMLTGRLPFEGGATAALAQRLTSEAPRVSALRSEVPAWLDGLVAHTLARSSGARLIDAAALARRLRDPHGAETVTLARPSVRRATGAAAPRREGRRPGRTLMVGLAAGAAATLAVVAVMAAGPRAAGPPGATAVPTVGPTATPAPTATPVGPPTPTAVVIRLS